MSYSFHITFFIFLSAIFSLPVYSLQEATNCMSCHVNPTGGGMRNDYGSNIYSLDELPLERWIEKGDEDWDGYISEHFQIGGDFRVQLFDDGAETSVFPMQADFYANVTTSKNSSLFLKMDLSGRLNNEYFILFNNIFKKGWVKFGKSISNYGLKIDDHTSFIRNGNSSEHSIFNGYDHGLFFDPKTISPTSIEIGSELFKNVSINLGLSTPYISPSLDEKGMINYSASINSIQKVDDLNILTGVSIMKESNIEALSFYGGFSVKKLSFVFELDKVNNYWETTNGKMSDSYASMLQVFYNPFQGLQLLAKYDYFDRDYNLLDGSVARHTVGFSIFPLNVFEIELQMRQYDTKNIANANNSNQEYLVQVHTWY